MKFCMIILNGAKYVLKKFHNFWFCISKVTIEKVKIWEEKCQSSHFFDQNSWN